MRKLFWAGASTLLLAALWGCATPSPTPAPTATTTPAKRTSVILLPDEDGHVGAVEVTSAAGDRQALTQAYQSVVVADRAGGVAAPQARAVGEITATYAEVLKAQPPRPKIFVLYFDIDSKTLTPESQAELSKVVDAAHARKPTEITVFGHADASGDEQRNVQLSAERASEVANILRRLAPDIGPVEVQFFGDKLPLVPTDGRTPDPRNRRVEIDIL